MKKRILTLFIGLLLCLSCFPTPVLAENSDPQKVPSEVPLSEIEQALDECAAKYIGSTVPGGSVVLVKNGETILSKSYGYADIKNGVPVDSNTVFEWGSTTKLLVWTSVMQLVEQGKLDLNADIRGYLPNNFFKKLKYDSPITMYNLMHHNAGWEDVGALFVVSPKDVLSLEEILHESEPNQVFKPGDVVAYSNYGAALAGYIVECISGQPFYEYVDNNIFTVLGMKDTAIQPCQLDNPDIAKRHNKIKGYTSAKGVLTPADPDQVYINMYPAGSVIGTPSDAAKFLSALLPLEGESSLLFKNSDTLKKMLSTSYSLGEEMPGIVHGFWENFYAVKTLGHAGDTLNFSSQLTFSPETGFGFVVMTNIFGSPFRNDMTNIVFGEYTPDYAGTLPDVSGLDSFFMPAKRPFTGFTKIFNFMQADSIKAINENTIKFHGMQWTQISPYIFKSETGRGPYFLHTTMDNSKVTCITINAAGSEFIATSGTLVFAAYASVILLAACILYIIATAFIMIIKGIKNKKKGIPSSLVKKLTAALNLFGIPLIINLMILLTTASYKPYSALIIHFKINIVYMLFAIICSCLIFIKLRITELSKGSKVFCILSCAVSIILTILLIVWEFYK